MFRPVFSHALKVFGCLFILATSSLPAMTDYNGDDLDDVWQQIFNGWGLDPNGDEDHDGCTNLTESVAGTDPRNPADCIRVGDIQLAGSNVVLSVVTETGKRYQLQSNTNPTGAAGTWTNEGAAVTGNGLTWQFVTPMGSGVNRKFYRVETLDQDSDGDGVSDWAEGQTGTNPAVGTSLSNASGGAANDGDTLRSLLSLTAAPVAGQETALERVDTTATTPVTKTARIALTRSFGTMPLTVTVNGAGGAVDSTKGNASTADFTVVGAPSGEITIPLNAGVPGSPYEVVINPVQDSTDEVPEALRVSFGDSATGLMGGLPSATVMIEDADPTLPQNRKLYVAYLGREAGVVSTASGVAVALLDGDNDVAHVSLNFSNLSSEQNTAYVRINSDQDVRNLNEGQVSNVSWPIRAAHNQFTDQAMLNALKAGQLYVDIPTINYRDGEIFGYFNRATGSTTFNPPPETLVAPELGSANWQKPTGEALEREIWRFLSQSTWGGTQALYDEVYAEVQTAISGGGIYITGLSNWLDKQMNPTLTPSINFRTLVMAADNEEFLLRGNKPSTYNSDPQINGSVYTVTFDAAGNPTVGTTADNNRIGNNYPQSGPNRRREWWTMILQCKDQVRQRMTQALSEILIISEADQTVLDRHYGCANYWDMLADGAFGKYRTLLEQVTYSPMMGIYLSHMANRATYDAGGGLTVSPDENYAREIMQLFSIGLVLRHPDGSLVLNTDGLPIATYDQTDITELARVMTGWSHGARHATGYQSSWSGTTLAFNNASSQRVSDLVLLNGESSNSVWFGRDDGHLYWAAPWLNPMKLIGRIGTTVYHDFNQYIDPATSAPVAGVSKRLLAGKHGQYEIPMRSLPATGTFANDVTCHNLAAQDMTVAHNCLAGDPNLSSYGAGTQASPGHQNTPVNISRWLIQRLVTSNPSAGYIYRVSEAYRRTNGNLGAVFKAILLDYEARSLQLADASISHGKVKEPLVAFASMLRALRAYSGAPVSILKDSPPPFSGTDSPLPGAYPASEFAKFSTANASPPSLPAGWADGPFRFRFNDLTGNIGQSPQRPPSVFNWFLPDFVVPGPMAEAGLFAPELQISTESSEVAKANMFYNYTWSNLVGQSTQPGQDAGISDFLLNNNTATPAVRFSLDGGVTFVNSLTFTSANFATPQTVTVVAANTQAMTSLDNSLLRFNITGAGSGYDNLPAAPIDIAFTDDERVNEGILALHTGFSTWVQESGKTDTVTVRLAAPPPTGTTVTVNVANTSGQITVTPTSFVFNSNTWNTSQTATVTAVVDTTAELPGAGGDTLTFTAAAGSGIYTGLSTAVPVGVVDNSAAAGTNGYGVLITETGGSTDVTETGNNGSAGQTAGVDTYTIVLTRQPSANVVVTCTPNRADVGLNTTTGGTTFSTTAVTRTFTNANWSTPQEVRVRGNDDGSRESSYPTNPMHNVTITHSVGATGGYAATSALQPVVAAITDNDHRIVLSHVGNGETRVKEGGNVADRLSDTRNDSITVALRVAPTANVTVNLGSNSVVCSPTNLVFTPANFDTPQTVFVSAVDDFVSEGAQPVLFSPGAAPTIATATSAIASGAVSGVTITNAGAGYAGIPTVTFSASSGTTATGTAIIGSNGTIVGVNISNPGAGYVTAPTVTFGAPQNAPALITASATSVNITDANYNNEWGNTYNGTFTQLNVTVLDNDAAGLVVTPSGGSTIVSEAGATDDYTVALAQQPVSDVTITFTPGAQVTLSGATLVNNILTFTSANWSTGQTVTVSGVNDTGVEGDALTSIGVLVTSTDKAYNGVKARAIPVTVIDNDSLVPVTIGHSNVFTGVSEAGTAGTGGTPNLSDTFTVQLPRAPTASVTVTILSDNSQVTVSPSVLTFSTAASPTAGGYNVNQTVTVTAFDDLIAEATPHNTTLRFAVTSTDPFYNNPAHLPVIIPIKDNDGPGFSIVESSGNSTPTEGGTDTYTVVLTKQPPAGQVVVIGVTSPSSADLLVSAVGTLNSCATTNASTTVTTSSTAGLVIGTAISGTGIPAGATVATIPTSTTFTLSAAATATNTGLSLTTTTIAAASTALAFNNTNWATAQTVTCTAIADMVTEGREVVTVNNAIDQALTTDNTFDALPPQTVVNFITEQHRRNASLVVIPSGGSIRSGDATATGGNTYVTEGDGSTDSVDFYLSNAPQFPVTVTLSANAQMGFSQSVFYFDASNWNIPQTVVVSAINDDFNDTYAVINGVVTLVTQSQNITFNLTGDPEFFANNPTSAVNILDNESPAVKIVQSGGITTSTEGGATDSYDVVLTTAPNNNVVVTCTPAGGSTINGSTNAINLTFTTANWSTPQTVTVLATNDTTVEGNHQSNITHTINTALTTDTSGYGKSLTACATTSGSTTVTCASTVGMAVGMNVIGTGIPANSTVGSVVNTTTFTLSAAATATNTGITLQTTIVGIQTVVNNINDNDNLVIVTPTLADTRVHEDGTLGDTYSVVLRSAPASSVTITPTVPANQGLSISPASRVFTTANWATPQSFTLSGVDNGNNADRARTVTITHAATGGSTAAVHSVGVSMLAKDNARILLIDNPSITENGATATYRVALNRAPTADVAIALTTPDGQQLVAPPIGTSPALVYGPSTTFTFTPANWMNFQTVTLRAVDDILVETPINTGSGYLHTGGVVQTTTSTDTAYNGAPAGTALATIVDNEVPAVRITPSGGTTILSEAGTTDSYDIVLSMAPTADVTVSITPDAQSTVSAASVTFNAGNWSTAQTITITAANDAAAESTHNTVITHGSAVSTDANFSGVPVPTLTGSITDNDGPQLVVNQTGGSTIATEGGANDTFTLALSTAPTANVTVTLIPPTYIIPVPPYAKQYGYYTTDLAGSNQQKDRVVMDYTEIILLYRTTFYSSLATAYGGSGNIPALPSDVNLQNAHWAACKAIVDKMDLWWCQGSLKAKNPVLVEPNQPAPSPLPGPNPRQVIMDCIYQINGGANSLGTTRYLPQVVFDPKNPPVGTFHDEIRDRARWAGYLMSTVMPGFVSH